MVQRVLELSDEQARRIEQIATERKVSVEELLADAVARLVGSGGLLNADERRRRAAAVSGRFQSDVTDLGRNHDKYLAEAFGE